MIIVDPNLAKYCRNPDGSAAVEIDIPDFVIQEAARCSYEQDAFMIVGEDLYFGWVFRHCEDTGSVEILIGPKFKVGSDGEPRLIG